MTDMLTPTMVYSLNGSTLIDYELKAYATAIDALFEMLSEIKMEAFFENGSSVAKEK